MRQVEIVDGELPLLQEYGRKSPLLLVRSKSQAVILAARGVGADIIAELVDRSARTVHEWLRGWARFRMGSLFTDQVGNLNASRLSAAERERVRQVLASPPSKVGIPAEYWSVPVLKEYLSTVFDVVYESKTSYHFLLKFAGLSFKYPSPFDRRRDEGRIEARMKEIRGEIAPLLADPGWEVFAADEVKVASEAIVRKAWLTKREQTKISVDREIESQSFIGFLNQRSFECEMFTMEWQDSDNVLLALDKFLRRHPGKRIAIVWDNAAFHKSKHIRDQLGKGGMLERVRLISMPPYAPDHNPIEHVWNTAKQQAANIQHDTFDQTITAFLAHTDHQVFRYQI